MIRFNCDGCGASISAPDDAAGKRGKCAKCGHANLVPAAAQPTVIAKPKQPIAVKPPAEVVPARVEVMPQEPAILTSPPPPPMIVQVVAPPAAVQVSQRVYVQASATNGLGTAGFVCSLLGFLTCGLLSPLGLFFSVIALFKPPRGMAFAGTVLGVMGSWWVFFFGGAMLLSLVMPRPPATSPPTFAAPERPSDRDSETSGPRQYVPAPTLSSLAPETPAMAHDDDQPEPTAEPTTVEREADELHKLRAWTDHKGKSIEAEFVSFANGVVRLRTASGKEVDLPVERLSDADQSLIREHLRGR